jgi:3-dehydroquinate synthase
MDAVCLDVRSAHGSYPVHIGDGIVNRLATLMDAAGLSAERFLVSNPLIWRLHGRAVAESLHDVRTILIPDGERFKHLTTVTRIYDSLLRSEADRAAVVIALGGGVVGDTAGFAAATYLRGVALVQVPTTLLAQVDSAIGGKVGVNHALGKNLVGAFHPPALVAIDPLLLATLPRREFRAGLYEVVKYGVIANRGLFDRLAGSLPAVFARDADVLSLLIVECCRIKADIVGADERERGPRRVLNLGHTAGHALEAVTRYRRFRHGEAVGYGLLVATEVAAGRGVLADDDREAIRRVIMQMGPLPPVADLSAAQTLEAVRQDKKVVTGQLHFVLPTAIGATTIAADVTTQELERALRAIGLRP